MKDMTDENWRDLERIATQRTPPPIRTGDISALTDRNYVIGGRNGLTVTNDGFAALRKHKASQE